jgi:4'-phosphopantetheinyl transferase
MKLAWKRLDGANAHEAGRELLRQLVGELPVICVTAAGKPYFSDNRVHFSITHTKGHAFCCVSHRNIGIDAEELSRKIDLRLADKILSPGEKARFDAAPDKNSALLRLWVLKESYAKLTGRGWGSYLYETDFDPDDPRVTIIDGCYVAIMED